MSGARRRTRWGLAHKAGCLAGLAVAGGPALADPPAGIVAAGTLQQAAPGEAMPGGGGPIVASPSVLPATGIGGGGADVRVGDLGQLSGGLAEPLPPAGRAWTVTPSLGLTEEYSTGNPGAGQGSGTRPQSITTLQPGLAASGDTTRLHGELSWEPQLELYSRDGRQNQVAQDFEGRLLATLLPQTVFLDLRGTGAVQALAAGQPPNQVSTLGRGDTTQTTSFSAAPYAVHRFGEWGSGEVGGALARTTEGAPQSGVLQSGALQELAAASNQNLTTTSGHAAFETGEAFGRARATALAQATRLDGGGVLRGAHRDTATLDAGYALTRTVTALATLGWESIRYGGGSPVAIDDAVYNAGLRLQPAADSTLSVRYGHRDGLNSLTVDAALQPTARIRVYARYSSGLATQAEQLQNALATSDLDALGNPVDHASGAPLLPVGTFFGAENSLYRTTLASLTGVLLLDRDSVSASLDSQTQTLVSAGNAAGLARGSTRGAYGTLTWSHQLRRNVQATLYAQYGTQRSGGGRDQTLAAVSASLAYALSRTLSGQLQYSYDQMSGGNQILNGGSVGSQSLLLVSLVKSF